MQSSALNRLTQPQTSSTNQPTVTLQSLLMPGSGLAAFPPGSRYVNTPTATMPLASLDPSDPTAQRTRVYLQTRIAPKPAAFTTAATHAVVEGERLDNVTAKYLTDPLQFWQLCDANAALRPWELVEDARTTIRIPMPSTTPSLLG